jgi:hypothetical protein
MKELFAFSYALASGLILLETLVLREALRRAAWIQQFYRDSQRGREWHALPPGTPAPKFSLPLLGTGRSLRTADLEGQPTNLFFVSPQDAAASPYTSLLAALHARWHTMKGYVYLVCTGAKESCRGFAHNHASGFPADKIICDEAGVLAHAFRINSTPQAVELDQDAKVKRYGRPKSLELDGQDSQGQQEKRAMVDGEGDSRSAWPDDRPMSGAGFARMDTAVSCVLTRFRLKSPLFLIPFYLAFRRVRRGARNIAGLMQALFLFEDLRTCYTLSLWKDDWSIVEFGDVHAHIDAANSAFNATYRKDLKRVEIWSAQFRLWAVSVHNLNWEGLDLKAALGDQWRRREELARTQGLEEEKTIA